jgi:ATP-dependent helicase/nuclease subunit B
VEVPLFADQRQPVAAQPLMRLLAAAFDMAAKGFTPDAMLRWLKTGLIGMEEDEIAEIETYILLWNITGSVWLREWTAHPQGLGAQANEHSAAQLRYLNILRERITAPLAAFRERMRDCTGAEGAAAADELLQTLRVPAALKRLRASFEENSQPVQAQELARVWDLCMDLLDQLAELPGTQPVGAARFAELFALALGCQTLGQLPQSLDAVTFGAADRVRFQSNAAAPRAVFVLGLNDGVFPKVPGSGGFLSAQDRNMLEAAGLNMPDSAPQLLQMERLIVYRTLTSAREKLWCSWALRNAAGEDLQPSRWAHWLCRLFPSVTLRDTQLISPLERLESEPTGFALLCEEHRQGGALYDALAEYFTGQPTWTSRLAALRRAAGEQPGTWQLQPEAAAALFRSGNEFSPSQAERYATCPFQHFCGYGLRLRAKKPADFDPLFRGNVLHSMLEQLFRHHGVDALLDMTPAQRMEALDALMNHYAAERLAGQEITARVTYLFRRLRDITARVLERLLAEFRASQFRPAAYELRIGMRQGGIAPFEVPLPGGDVLHMGGKADRVDCAIVNGKPYFRVVDYKSGGKEFSLAQVFDGLNLQMLVYLFALWGSGTEPFAGALPAGVLYSQAADAVLTVDNRYAPLEAIAKEQQSKARANGFILEDTDVLLAMEEGGAGLFLPAKLDSKNTLKQHVLSLARLGKLRQAAQDILAQQALALRAGSIPALPLRNGEHTPCGFCDYRAICGHEPGQAEKNASKLSFEQAVTLLDAWGEDT